MILLKHCRTFLLALLMAVLCLPAVAQAETCYRYGAGGRYFRIQNYTGLDLQVTIEDKNGKPYLTQKPVTSDVKTLCRHDFNKINPAAVTTDDENVTEQMARTGSNVIAALEAGEKVFLKAMPVSNIYKGCKLELGYDEEIIGEATNKYLKVISNACSGVSRLSGGGGEIGISLLYKGQFSYSGQKMPLIVLGCSSHSIQLFNCPMLLSYKTTHWANGVEEDNGNVVGVVHFPAPTDIDTGADEINFTE